MATVAKVGAQVEEQGEEDFIGEISSSLVSGTLRSTIGEARAVSSVLSKDGVSAMFIIEDKDLLLSFGTLRLGPAELISGLASDSSAISL